MAQRKAKRSTAPAAWHPAAREALAWLERRGTKQQIAELARYGIDARRPFGVTVGALRDYAKTLARDQALADALWASGRYEARLLAAFVGEPERLTVQRMNAWAAEFDNWAVVDSVCFHLFDRTPRAWSRIAPWAKSKPEFKKRAAFALLWGLSVHDREASDDAFAACLPILEAAATDERNFVKKAVDMALRAVGKRNRALNRAALATAERLARSEDATAGWIGRHARRELASPAVRKRLGSARC